MTTPGARSSVYAHRPAPRLGGCVEQLWSWRGAPSHPTERIVPDGGLQLLVNLAEDRLHHVDLDGTVHALPAAIVTGAFDVPFTVLSVDQRDIVGVAFAPGGARPFLGCPTSELLRDNVSLAELWGQTATDALREALYRARDDGARLDVLEQALLARLVGAPGVERRVRVGTQLLCRAPDVGCAAEAVNLSRRAFTRLFREHVGLAPKRWGRIQRFNQALDGLFTAPDLTTLALACGYFDHAHFSREFADFAGTTPTAVLAGRRNGHHLVLGG